MYNWSPGRKEKAVEKLCEVIAKSVHIWEKKKKARNPKSKRLNEPEPEPTWRKWHLDSS